ncbi:AMP-binding protein, partial [Bradyrhizobium sp.]|uniref:AMP-binding protein n=1 Tax=Bradyrhizobium sp. TaxID=376 RepID=UPI003C6EF975
MRERTSAPVRGVTGHATVEPGRPAMIMGGTVRTYGELDDRARRLASVLGDLGAGPGRPVATVLPNGIEMFEVATAAAMLNAP